jgi:hypothetical protein
VSADALTGKVSLNGGGGGWNPEWETDLSRFELDPFLASTNGQGPTAATSFEARVTGTHVDLLQRIDDGIPPIDYLPASEGMFVRGKRHQLPAPKKSGKSICMEVHWVEMALAGARVVILDRENGANLYASRLEQIIAARGLDDEERETLRANLRYHEFPRLTLQDGDKLAAMCAGADIVVFDAQRMFLTDLGLAENDNDDYATFVWAAIDPLFRAGIATMILDNTGHEEKTRSRGASSKGDLNEVLFGFEVVDKFDIDTVGKVRLSIDDTRFGNRGHWEMTIGGGMFEPWQPVDKNAQDSRPRLFRPTGYMERVSVYLECQHEPVSRSAVEDAIPGHSRYVRVAMDCLVREGYAEEQEGPRNARLMLSKQAFREHDLGHDLGQTTSANLGQSSATDKPLNHADSDDLGQPRPTSATTPANDLGHGVALPYGEPGDDGRGQNAQKDAHKRAALFDAQFPPSVDRADVSHAREEIS